MTSSGMTHTGLVRDRNEDSFGCMPEQNLWIVADGMGGHEAGDFASQTIIEQAEKFTQQKTLADSILLLEENLLHSNGIIREKANKLGSKYIIGSTVICLYIWGNMAFVLWAGDSRVYLYREQTMQRLTEDHSFVEELVKMGKLEQDQAEAHPASNVVLNAIGIDSDLVIDMEYYEIEDGDLFIVCSDGLYKDLSETYINEILYQNEDKTLEELNQILIDASLASGGNDNCTVVLVRAESETSNV
ncbi:MAG: protein phosphatase 2C domain-containing protein [Gammaproteobacteria bacterium]|nr:protein phosphatase 2C domain-containing protein [Gammaproteobacteria bacterium]